MVFLFHHNGFCSFYACWLDLAIKKRGTGVSARKPRLGAEFKVELGRDKSGGWGCDYETTGLDEKNLVQKANKVSAKRYYKQAADATEQQWCVWANLSVY